MAIIVVVEADLGTGRVCLNVEQVICVFRQQDYSTDAQRGRPFAVWTASEGRISVSEEDARRILSAMGSELP